MKGPMASMPSSVNGEELSIPYVFDEGIKVKGSHSSNFYSLEDDQLPPNFKFFPKGCCDNGMQSFEGSQVLNFIQSDALSDSLKEYSIWDSNVSYDHSFKDINSFQTSGSWLYSGSTLTSNSTSSLKRPHKGDFTQRNKKHCNDLSPSKKERSHLDCLTKDPQSVAAKQRRERISERLKTLQELVPNGSKVDLVTMLEKAISYVKFLQLQVKVLATDEFWPDQGGKAPNVSQVKEAIDAILFSKKVG